MSKSHGGQRPNAGRKSQYNEPTKGVKFTCPKSKVEELKAYVKEKLKQWAIPMTFLIMLGCGPGRWVPINGKHFQQRADNKRVRDSIARINKIP